MAKEIKKFDNEYLLNEWANLELIENTFKNSTTNLPTSTPPKHINIDLLIFLNI